MKIAVVALLGLATVLSLIAQPADPVIDQVKTFMNSNQYEKAVDLLEKAVAAKPNDATRHFWLARAYVAAAPDAGMFSMMSLGRKVGNEFATAVKLDPNYIEARLGLLDFDLMAPGLMGGGVDKAREQAGEIRKRDALAGHRAFAKIAAKNKDINAERAEYVAAVRENPNSPQAHYWYGTFLLLTEKNYKASGEEFEAALRVHVNYMPAYFQIGHLAALSGANLAQGEGALQKYLAYQPVDDDPPPCRAY